MTTNHNPASISPQEVGPNHRLLTTEELDKPLPEGAEMWNPEFKWWRESVNAKYGRKPDPFTTYRIPLTLSDRLRSEIAEREELIKIADAVQAGAHYEHDCRREEWHEPSPAHQNVNELMMFFQDGYKLRLKPLPPAPRSISWTLDSHPDVVCVKSKLYKGPHLLITRWCEGKAFIEDHGFVTYHELHSDWLQRNGDPAGQEVTPA